MALYYWAVAVAALGWFLVGRLAAQRAKIDTTGKVPTPTRYLRRSALGAGVVEVDWGITKQEPVSFVYTVVLAGLSITPLAAVMIPWNWLKITILSILSLLMLMIWAVLTSLDIRYYREVDRQEKAGEETGTTYEITYELEAGPSAKKSDVLTVFAVVLFWTGAYWGFERIGLDDWVLVRVLLAGLMLMVGLMYVIEKREQLFKQRFPFDYCKRCGRRLKRETRPVVHREHRGGPYYVQRTDYELYEKCPLCGYEHQI